jgi:hypothetical protein
LGCSREGWVPPIEKPDIEGGGEGVSLLRSIVDLLGRLFDSEFREVSAPQSDVDKKPATDMHPVSSRTGKNVKANASSEDGEKVSGKMTTVDQASEPIVETWDSHADHFQAATRTEGNRLHDRPMSSLRMYTPE